MIFSRTIFPGALLVDIERHEDERGYFARTVCRKEFSANGLVSDFVQSSRSHNRKHGTLRGMHYQRAPHAEVKLISCVRGAIFDVIVDLRAASPTYLKWAAFELTADNARMLYVPQGFAHGFQTLADDTDVLYEISQFYVPDAQAGLRYDDPAIGIRWPEPVSVISPRDAALPYLATEAANEPVSACAIRHGITSVPVLR